MIRDKLERKEGRKERGRKKSNMFKVFQVT